MILKLGSYIAFGLTLWEFIIESWPPSEIILNGLEGQGWCKRYVTVWVQGQIDVIELHLVAFHCFNTPDHTDWESLAITDFLLLFTWKHDFGHFWRVFIWSHLQIDNQLLDAYHQTVLSCVPTPAYLVKKKGPKPCIEFGMIRRVVPENNVDTFR